MLHLPFYDLIIFFSISYNTKESILNENKNNVKYKNPMSLKYFSS
jgi:hypothetical protein